MKAVIFDLDGVLVDTAKYHFLAWCRLAQQLGFEFTAADNEQLKGVSRLRSLDILLEVGGVQNDFDDAQKQKLATLKNGWYLEYVSRMTPAEVLPGVRPLLLSIRQAGLKIALGSASSNAQLILHKTALFDDFDVIIDGMKVKKAKPDPEVFTSAAHALGVPNDQCVVFEDAQAGIQAALAAGMKCVGVGSADILSAATIVLPNLENSNWQHILTKL